MITVHGEIDFTTYKESIIPYVELEVKEEPSYHSFEMISMVQIPAGCIIKSPEFSISSIMSGRVLCQYVFTLGNGLGSKSQGIKEPITSLATRMKNGVGYIPDNSKDHHRGQG